MVDSSRRAQNALVHVHSIVAVRKDNYSRGRCRVGKYEVLPSPIVAPLP